MNANQTEVIRQSLDCQAYLESASGAAPERSILEQLPYTIGRTDATDLKIDSNQVSREHATIYRAGNEIRIRDNGSTNGTFVNSQRITDSLLSEGDLLTIADVDLIFHASPEPTGAASATEVMQPRTTDTSEGLDRNLSHTTDLRRMQQMLTHGCVECSLRPLVDLETNEPVAVEAEASWSHGAGCRRTMERVLNDGAGPISNHLQYLQYLAAAEEFSTLGGLQYLILPARADTIDTPRFHRLWEQLAAGLAGQAQVVIEIHDPSPRNAAGLASLMNTMHGHQLLVSYAATTSSTAQLRDMLEAGVDFIKLAEGMIAGLHEHRQRERQVLTAIELCHSLGARAIAAGVTCGKDAEICRQLKCDFATGSYFGDSLTNHTDSSVHEPVVAGTA